MSHQKMEAPLIDPFGRAVTYLRISVTDRCDFRCQYCMSENMTFLPKKDLLTFEELAEISSSFVALGTRKIRISGGEPLVRKNILTLFEHLGRFVADGQLDELTLTTNGSQLKKYAEALYANHVRRINVSLDTLDEQKFATITRWGRLGPVLEGIEAAKQAGLKIKINTVAMKGFNDQEIPELIRWAHGEGHDISLIETMPMGDVAPDRVDQYQSLTELLHGLKQNWTITQSSHKTGGPAVYYDIAETGGRLGLITPMSHNFCESCNRVRLTCTGILYMCLGQEDSYDLRQAYRNGDNMISAIRQAITMKPKGHDFVIDRDHGGISIDRHMSVTGG